MPHRAPCFIQGSYWPGVVCGSAGEDFAGGYRVGVSIVDVNQTLSGGAMGGAVAASIARIVQVMSLKLSVWSGRYVGYGGCGCIAGDFLLSR